MSEFLTYLQGTEDDGWYDDDYYSETEEIVENDLSASLEQYVYMKKSLHLEDFQSTTKNNNNDNNFEPKHSTNSFSTKKLSKKNLSQKQIEQINDCHIQQLIEIEELKNQFKQLNLKGLLLLLFVYSIF